MHKRVGLGKKARFSVLVRDGHRCRYCGATSVDAKLVVDHIIPVKQGGSNIPENLITACQPCNAGKGARTPSGSAPTPHDAVRVELAVREQATLSDSIRDAAALRLSVREEVGEYYCCLRDKDSIDGATLSVMVHYVNQVGMGTLCRWMETANLRLGAYASDQKFGKYVSGIRRMETQAQQPTANRSEP